MSLYSDLNEILTPYAHRIKGLAAENDKVKADLSESVSDLKSGLNDIESMINSITTEINAPWEEN